MFEHLGVRVAMKSIFLSIIVTMVASFAAAEAMDKTLPPHQLESGLVTSGEVELSQRWVATVTADVKPLNVPTYVADWLSTTLPFTFKYGGLASASLLPHWSRHCDQPHTDSVSQRQSIVWTDPATGLRVIWEVKRFLDFPAVEWVLRFENKGSKDTPIIDDVRALDLRLKRSGDEPYRVAMKRSDDCECL